MSVVRNVVVVCVVAVLMYMTAPVNSVQIGMYTCEVVDWRKDESPRVAMCGGTKYAHNQYANNEWTIVE